MTLLPAAHLIGNGPLDFLLEVGLPVIVFAGLWWWSARAERKRKREGDEKKEP